MKLRYDTLGSPFNNHAEQPCIAQTLQQRHKDMTRVFCTLISQKDKQMRTIRH